jgi:PBSX family phage terminase large subunit
MAIDTLSPKQRETVKAATARINIWHGSVRSGKTVASQIAWVDFVRKGPPGTFVMAGRTRDTLDTNVLQPLQEFLGPRRMQLHRSRGMATICGRPVRLRSFDNATAELKVRGATFAGAYVDEVTTAPQSFFAMLDSRLSIDGSRLYGTTNADGPVHWLKTEYLDREHELDLRSFHFTLDDNPYLPQSYKDALRVNYTSLWRKRFIEGLWVAAQGAIWDAFDSDRHVVDLVPADAKWKTVLLAVDYGTANPFVALLVGLDSKDQFWVIDEWRWDSRAKGRQLSDLEYSAALVEWLKPLPDPLKPSRTLVDPSAASFIVQARQDGLPDVCDAANDVDDGLRMVNTTFSRDRLFIARKCAQVRKEISSYSWDPKAQARGLDQPIKANDHGCDALRYAIYTTLRPNSVDSYISFLDAQLAKQKGRA